MTKLTRIVELAAPTLTLLRTHKAHQAELKRRNRTTLPPRASPSPKSSQRKPVRESEVARQQTCGRRVPVHPKLREIEALTREIREARICLAELVASMRKRRPTIRLRMEDLRERIESVAAQQRALTARCCRLHALFRGKPGSRRY